MNHRDGRRGGARGRPATFPKRARRSRAQNGRAAGQTAPIGALVISPDGGSKFYPEGGRDRPGRARDPPSVRRKRENNDLYYGTKPPLGPQTVIVNNSFVEKPDFDVYDMSMPRLDDDDDHDTIDGSENDTPLSPRQTSIRSLLIFSCVGVGVLLVVTFAIIFPVAFLGSTSNGPNVTGDVQLDTSFMAEYDNVGSTDYNNVVNDFISVMDDAFEASSTYSGSFSETKVTDLSPGSTSPANTVVSFSVVFKSGTDITMLFRNNIYGFVYEEMGKTPFTQLDVLRDTLKINESCNMYCHNGGTLSSISCTCTCPTDFSGTTCKNEI